MEDKDQYKALLSEIIQKQAIILGPHIAILKARNVPDLVVDNDGKVTDIKGDPKEIMEKLIDEKVDKMMHPPKEESEDQEEEKEEKKDKEEPKDLIEASMEEKEEDKEDKQ